MNRLQIILLLVGIGLVVLLFSLPKTLVNTSAKKIDTESNATMKQSGNKGAISFSSEEVKQIKLWKINYATIENNLDSLINIYIKHLYYDSAAYYVEQRYTLKKKQDDLVKTAVLYEQAATVEIDSLQAQFYNQKARASYEELVEKNPSRYDFKTKLARLIVYSDNPMRGIKILREVVEKDPRNREALDFLGRFSIQSGQYDKAVERYEQLVKYYPSDTVGRYWLGYSYAQAGRKQDARSQFEWIEAKLISKKNKTKQDSLLMGDAAYQRSLLQ